VETIRKRARSLRLRALTTALALTLLAAVLLAGGAQAAPGRPTALTPKGTSTVATGTPTFKWNKAARAGAYEVRVYEGTALQVKETGIAGLSWKCKAQLSRAVTYSWKIRARKAGVNGPWSKSLEFTVSPVLIGDDYQGGVVAYVLQPGDTGYVPGETHGLIAAAADQVSNPPGIQWATEPYWNISVPGTSTAIGSGAANTSAIIAQNGAGTSYAAGLARAYAGGGYNDWFLPSLGELGRLYVNRVTIGGFDTAFDGTPWYGCSSEDPGAGVWELDFCGGSLGTNSKAGTNRVRAVRSF
jgi:hypothetical protein